MANIKEKEMENEGVVSGVPVVDEKAEQEDIVGESEISSDAPGDEGKLEKKPISTEKKANAKPKASKVKKADETVKRLISRQTVLKGIVLGARNDEGIGEYVTVYNDNREFVILKSELGLTQDIRNVLGLIGKSICFVATEYDGINDRIIASRAKAQEFILKKIIADDHEGRVYKGEITALLPYGAYIEVNGVSGILKNVDFSVDHLQIADICKVGDELDVCLKRTYSENKLEFDVPKKFTRCEHPNLDRYKVDSIVQATVVSDKETHFFARVMPGVDAYCKLPFNDEVFVGDKVLIKILENKIGENGKLSFKGKWIRTVK